jgi:hypothetical protein
MNRHLSNATYSVYSDMPREQSYIMSQGLTESLCLRHPIYGECPLTYKSHECQQCENCAVYGRGDCKDPVKWEPPPQYENTCMKKELTPCKHPDCLEMSYTDYCQPCATVINNRRHKYKKEHPGEKTVPIEILHAPIGWKKRLRKNTISQVFHKDDMKLPNMVAYDRKLEIVKGMGYESVSQCLIDLYTVKLMGLKKIGSETGIYHITVSKCLKILGIKIRKPGRI